MSNKLLNTVYQNEDNLLSQVKLLIKQNANVNYITEYNESALRVASKNGRFDVVKTLLDAGGDAKQLEWTPLFFNVVYGNLQSIKDNTSEYDIYRQDFWGRTPWLLAIQTGDIAKTKLLLELGASTEVVGRCGNRPMAYAVQHDNVMMLNWLVELGLDIESLDDFSNTLLIVAAQYSAVKCAQRLIELGADIFRENNAPYRAIEDTENLEIIQLLVDSGDDINDISEEAHAKLIGSDFNGKPNILKADYELGRSPRFGTQNPEKVEVAFYLEMIKSGADAYTAQCLFNQTGKDSPVWCYRRFGRTTTILDDGRMIEVAGEHEDFYDADFYIYNDVTVFNADGKIDHYLYPEAIFPSTDFHTATLVGDLIYIIGSLGYGDKRDFHATSVYTLNIHSFEIAKIATKGDMPGWVSRHKAYFDGESIIRIEKGEKWVELKGEGDLVPNPDIYELNIETREWTQQVSE